MRFKNNFGSHLIGKTKKTCFLAMILMLCAFNINAQEEGAITEEDSSAVVLDEESSEAAEGSTSTVSQKKKTQPINSLLQKKSL
ncbi:MAG: hypothetical protein ACO2ZP_10775 [Bacteriovoracaceae bacterium]